MIRRNLQVFLSLTAVSNNVGLIISFQHLKVFLMNVILCLGNETLTNPEEDTKVEVTSPQPSEEQPSEEQVPLATKQVASPAPVSEPNVDSTSEASITPPVAEKGRMVKAPSGVDGYAVLQVQSMSKMILPSLTTLTISPKVVLFILHMSRDTNKSKTITVTHIFDDTLGLIHETIGCADVMHKPELSYKLSDSAQKSSAIGLCYETMCERLLYGYDSR